MCIRPIRYITYSVFLILGVLFVLFMAAITSNNPPPELAELSGHRELATIIRILFFSRKTSVTLKLTYTLNMLHTASNILSMLFTRHTSSFP